MYESIPQQDLRWLNNLSGKTGTVLEASDQTAPEGWLPPGIASRLEAGKTYVMTLAGDAGTEIIAVTGSALVRGLEGTTPREWPAGTDIFQAVTAGQIQWLVSTMPLPAPPELDLTPVTLTIGSFGDMYGFSAGAAGSSSVESLPDYGAIIGIGWSSNDLAVFTENFVPGGLHVRIGEDDFILKQCTHYPGEGFDYSVRVLASPEEGDATTAQLSQLPANGTLEMEIGQATWKGYQGSLVGDAATMKIIAGNWSSYYGFSRRDSSDIGYTEPGYIQGFPQVVKVAWSRSLVQVYVRLRGEGLPDQVDLTIGGETFVLTTYQSGYDREYGAGSIGTESAAALPNAAGEYIVTIKLAP